MITPSPTTKIDPALARGTFQGMTSATPTRPALVMLAIPDTSYTLHLVPKGEAPSVKSGKRVVGTIACEARRLDKTGTGGRYVEPVMGPPQRVQGTVIATDEATKSVTINCTVPVRLTLTHPANTPGQFQPGDLVACDLLEGATFEVRE